MVARPRLGNPGEKTMLSTMFDNSTIPMLEQVVSFTEARHGVLAGNIANMDTPGYRTRDLSPELFQAKLREAIDTKEKTPKTQYVLASEAMKARGATVQSSHQSKKMENHDGMDKVRESLKDILFHDDSDVSLEHQVTEISKNQAQHNLAISIMASQFRLLRAAISERA